MTDPISQQQLITAGGADKTYVDDVFSTDVYMGTGSAKTITNGVDLAGEGGLVWCKARSASYDHNLFDTIRGPGRPLQTNATSPQQTQNLQKVSSFNNNGFSLGNETTVNPSGHTMASWTFRQAPGFFDVVTYTGNGVSGRQVAHGLGSVPGFMIVKQYDKDGEAWAGWHRTMPNTTDAGGWSININTTNGGGGNGGIWNSTNPTATHFTVGNDSQTNEDTYGYVAYIWAHDEQSFGEGGDQSIVKCGGYEGNGNVNGPVVNLGWEPQFVIIKEWSDNGENWAIFDSMRGIVSGGDDKYLYANSNGTENTYDLIELTSTGFKCVRDDGTTNTNGQDYIYIAIRRPDGYVGKPALAGTDVFAMDTGASSSTIPNFDSGFPVDWAYDRAVSGANWDIGARLIQGKYLNGNDPAAAGVWAPNSFDSNVGWNHNGAGSGSQSWMWKRGQSFDVVCYKGINDNQTINHGLNRVPEMMISKGLDFSDWYGVYHKDIGIDKYLRLNTSNGTYDNQYIWQGTTPTSSVFYLGLNQATNYNGHTHIMFLFASVDGISKVGTYSGSGAAQTITTGFQPRLILLKQYNNSNSWNLFDSLRGITSNPLQLENSNGPFTAADKISVSSTGWGLTSATFNGSGQEYIYYAHA